MALVPDISQSARPKDYDLIECVDLTTSLQIETVDRHDEPALGPGETEGFVQDPSIGPDLTSGYQENNGPLPHIEELLRGAGEAQAPQDTAANVNYESGSADGAARHPASIERDSPTPAMARSGDTRRETDSRSNIHQVSNSSTAVEQAMHQCP